MPKTSKTSASAAKYPRHALGKLLRIPQGILDQNAGKAATLDEVAKFCGLSKTNGVFNLEVSSAVKFGLIERDGSGNIAVGDIARKILKPKSESEKSEGLVQAIERAPNISDVYLHYRGEFLPQNEFFTNALTDRFHIPGDKVSEFVEIFKGSLEVAGLISEKDGKLQIINKSIAGNAEDRRLDKLTKGADIKEGDSCFVVMPFAPPIGGYFSTVYEPAIKKAGLLPVRADNEIFGTGKIIDQIYKGISSAKVLVAELTNRNPNVFYELGLAHGLKKPVVLISANETDVPFDVRHIRVIYYDVSDPFWGSKLIDKVAENIISALKNPEEAIISFK